MALYDYKSRDESDLSFMKGDRMEVIDDTESDWWRVVNLSTRQEGLIPLNFVAEERSVNSEEYVFAIAMKVFVIFTFSCLFSSFFLSLQLVL